MPIAYVYDIPTTLDNAKHITCIMESGNVLISLDSGGLLVDPGCLPTRCTEVQALLSKGYSVVWA